MMSCTSSPEDYQVQINDAVKFYVAAFDLFVQYDQDAKAEEFYDTMIEEFETTTEDDATSMKGLKSGAGMLISGGTFTIDSADDSFHSDTNLTVNGGVFTIASGDDAVHAEDTLTITACTMNVTTCYEGLEAEYIYVQGGDYTLNCDDDGLNASGGTDGSGGGGRDQMFGPGGGMGGAGNGAIEISGGNATVTSAGASKIRVTTDGTDPRFSDTAVETTTGGAVPAPSGAVVKAVAFSDTLFASEVAEKKG